MTTMASALWADLEARFGADGLLEVRDMLRSWSGDGPRLRCDHPGQNYNELYLPGLPAEIWFEPDRFWFHGAVIEALPDLITEGAQLADGRIEARPVNDGLGPTGPNGITLNTVGYERPVGWREWFFYRLNQRREEVRAGFPVSAALADTIAAREWVVSIGFQVMKPGVRLSPHSDVGNFLATVQFGVITPPGSGLRVAGETRDWRAGACFAFDNSYLHEAWNDADSCRILFSAYVLHPSLTPIQRAAFVHLASRFDFTQAPELVNGGRGDA